MRFLLTNDDGIYAKGIEAIYFALREKGHEVTVVAPLGQRSGVGHGLTYLSPIRVEKVFRNQEFFGYGVEGNPGDCVKWGLRHLMKEPPDRVVSGINNGYNFGFHVYYSGTVAGAMEGAIQKVPSIALSTNYHRDNDFSTEAAVAADLVDEVVQWDLSWEKVLNINIPRISSPGEIAGKLITKQSFFQVDAGYELNSSPFGQQFYWLKGKAFDVNEDLAFDDAAVSQGYVSITPLDLDRTCDDTFERLKSQLEGKGTVEK